MNFDLGISEHGKIHMDRGSFSSTIVLIGECKDFFAAALQPDVDVATRTHVLFGVHEGVALPFQYIVAEAIFQKPFRCLDRAPKERGVVFLEAMTLKHPFHDIFVAWLVAHEIVFPKASVLHEDRWQEYAWDCMFGGKDKQVVPIDVFDA